MSKTSRAKIAIPIIQILCVLSWDIYCRYFSHFSTLNTFNIYGIPIIISSIATFLFCIFSSKELRFKELIWLSSPASLVYLITYAILPSADWLIENHETESNVFTVIIFFVFDIPLATLLLFANSSMGWLGLFLHTKLVMPQENSI